jgi:L-2-hydroxyglutarate oxidase LhgO
MAAVTVIGAGVVGLSTAINIQRMIPSVSVTVVAENVLEGTTSVGAGAIFRPTKEYLPGVDVGKVRYM